MASSSSSSADLARSITRAASRQTDLTISLLVDRDRVDDASRAYAYFRWVDDRLDQAGLPAVDLRAFLGSQQRLVESAYHGHGTASTAEEQILLDLIAHDRRPGGGLAQYVRHLMEVMAFDVDRRGRQVSADDLARYTRSLSIAVTEGLHHFIGHGQRSPRPPGRYQAVVGAHLAHMLRDLPEDLSLGYINIPREVLDDRRVEKLRLEDSTIRRWVRSRVESAHRCLGDGRARLREVENLRCRIAMLAYTLRFESVLTEIENAGYILRPGMGAVGPSHAWVTLARAVLVAAAPNSGSLRRTANPEAGSEPT